MPTPSLLLLATLIALLGTQGTATDKRMDGKMQGQFLAKDGSKCLWFEIRQKREEASLAMACSCKTVEDKMESFSCMYKGDLSNCKAYKDNSKRLYESIVKKVSEDHDNGCKADKIHVRACDGAVLTKNDRVAQKAACSPSQAREEL